MLIYKKPVNIWIYNKRESICELILIIQQKQSGCYCLRSITKNIWVSSNSYSGLICLCLCKLRACTGIKKQRHYVNMVVWKQNILHICNSTNKTTLRIHMRCDEVRSWCFFCRTCTSTLPGKWRKKIYTNLLVQVIEHSSTANVLRSGSLMSHIT